MQFALLFIVIMGHIFVEIFVKTVFFGLILILGDFKEIKLENI